MFGLVASVLAILSRALGLAKWWTAKQDREENRRDGANEAALEAHRKADELVRSTRTRINQVEVDEDRIMSDPNNRLRR